MTKEVILKSGAELKITLSPFAVSKNLYSSVLEELKELKLNSETDIDVGLIKDIFCVGFSSKKIESALNECMKRVLYKGNKIGPETFEPIENREDYMEVCYEVAKENILPFLKSLSAKFEEAQKLIKNFQA